MLLILISMPIQGVMVRHAVAVVVPGFTMSKSIMSYEYYINIVSIGHIHPVPVGIYNGKWRRFVIGLLINNCFLTGRIRRIVPRLHYYASL